MITIDWIQGTQRSLRAGEMDTRSLANALGWALAELASLSNLCKKCSASPREDHLESCEHYVPRSDRYCDP